MKIVIQSLISIKIQCHVCGNHIETVENSDIIEANETVMLSIKPCEYCISAACCEHIVNESNLRKIALAESNKQEK